MEIRLARKDDINEIVELLKETHPVKDTATAREEIAEMFSESLNPPEYIIAVEDDKIIGVTGFINSWYDFNTYEIFWVAVHPDFQRQGIGKAIISDIVGRLKKVEEQFKARILILTTGTPEFFEKCSFEKVMPLGYREGFLMVRKL